MSPNGQCRRPTFPMNVKEKQLRSWLWQFIVHQIEGPRHANYRAKEQVGVPSPSVEQPDGSAQI